MKSIIISGPSGSGKTTLSKKLFEELKGGVIINTDNYYKTGIKSWILSKIILSYFDKSISINFTLLKNDINNILKNKKSNYSYYYDFLKKKVKKIHNKPYDVNFLIVEGIFSNKLLDYFKGEDLIFIILNKSKDSCLNRVIKRDILERGKKRETISKDFLNGWKIFNENLKRLNLNIPGKKFVFNHDPDIKEILKVLNN